MIEPEIIKQVNSIYTLLALIVLAIVYIVGIIHTKYLQKKQYNDIIANFNIHNNKLLEKIDDIKEDRNSLDLQSSMDIIHISFTKSMNKVMEGIRVIIEENHIEDKERKDIIYEKIKNIINTQCDDDYLILGRIYYKNIQLSTFLKELDKFDLIETIHSKLALLKDKKHFVDVMDYIRNKYSHAIQSAQIKISK